MNSINGIIKTIIIVNILIKVVQQFIKEKKGASFDNKCYNI